MKATGTWLGGYETRLEDGRGHTVTTDLDREEGGGDRGTSALELGVLALAGCITTIFALVAERRRLSFAAMRIELEALRPTGARTITSVEGSFFLATSAAVEDVETALAITLRTCPIGVIFDRAGIPVRVRTVVSPAAVPVPLAPAGT
jgi:putative redox protein